MSPILIISILFISALVSGLAIFVVKRDNTNLLKLILSFSGAYLFAITVLHLIPHVYHAQTTSPEIIGLYILGGFIFQLLLEQFSQGIEHGHIHHHNHGAFPLGIMVSLCLHAFLEGMPLISNQQTQLVFGIAIHHIPAAFALGSLLINTSLKRQTIILMLVIFAAMTPLGFLTSKALSSNQIGDISQHFDKMMAVVIGIFLHISTTILFESGSADHHKFNKKKMIAVFLGIFVSLSSFIFHTHDHDHGDHDHGHQHNHEHSTTPHNHNHNHDHNHDHEEENHQTDHHNHDDHQH